MHATKWLKYFFIFSFLFSLPLAIFNYWMDPLWVFSHSHKYNQYQVGFNERQLKTNNIYFNGLEQYDTLLLGSSRSTYINQKNFTNMHVFNLSSANMIPSEYKNWIKVAKKIKKSEFKYIIIGIDFWSSSKNGKKQIKKQNKQAQFYFNTVKEPFYRYKTLISFNTFEKSKENFKHYKYPSTIDYTRENIKQTIIVTKDRKEKTSQIQYKNYKENIYGENYIYQSNFKALMSALKTDNPQTKFIIFTTPISAKLFKLLLTKGNYDDYKKWLLDTVDIFGKVYNFMEINAVTSNENNYPDLHHFYPFIGKSIANAISKKGINTSKDFGIILTKDNIKRYFNSQDKLYKPYITNSSVKYQP